MMIAFELGYGSIRFHLINAWHYFGVNPQELANVKLLQFWMAISSRMINFLYPSDEFFLGPILRIH